MKLNSKFQKYDLNHKVDKFIQQYDSELRNVGSVTTIGEFHFPQDLRNNIETRAVLAEFRWPFVYGRECAGNEVTANEELDWTRISSNVPMSFPPLSITQSVLEQQILHRIIERGGNRVGPRRGIVFAEDTGLDINFPVQYSIDWSDPHLYDLLKPLVPRLDLEMLCPVGYFSRSSDSYRGVEEVRLRDIVAELSVRDLQTAQDTAGATVQ